VRLLTDHCVPEGVIRALRDAGHQPVRLVDALRPDAADREVAELAARLDAVLVTADSDFLRRCDFPPRRFAGIVVLRDLQIRPETLARRLLRLLDRLGPEDLRGVVAVLDRRSSRFRR
jgi:predicted nuclease of predicted toxin-antitoxin system